MGTQSECLARWECVLQSPTSLACTTCTAPAPVVRPLPSPAEQVCWPSLRFVLRPRASRAGGFSGWLRVLELFWLLACFYSHRAAVRRLPGFFLVSTSLLPTLNDLLIRSLVPAGLLAQRWESPRRLRVVALDAAFSSAVRMIHRVHGHAAHGGLDAAPPRASGLAERFILMVKVANLANRSHAIDRKLSYFTAGHLHKREIAFFTQKLRRSARGAHRLPAASRIQLQVVYHGAGRNVANLQRVAGKNVRAFAG